MKRMKKVVSIVLIMATLCLLTGCSFVKAETTIQVSVDADGKSCIESRSESGI